MARHMLFFAINMTFSIATPLILPFAVYYYAGVSSESCDLSTLIVVVLFTAAHLFNKYNLLYVHIPEAHGNGKMFEAIFLRSYVGLAIFQVSRFAFLLLRLCRVSAINR